MIIGIFLPNHLKHLAHILHLVEVTLLCSLLQAHKVGIAIEDVLNGAVGSVSHTGIVGEIHHIVGEHPESAGAVGFCNVAAGEVERRECGERSPRRNYRQQRNQSKLPQPHAQPHHHQQHGRAEGNGIGKPEHRQLCRCHRVSHSAIRRCQIHHSHHGTENRSYELQQCGYSAMSSLLLHL